MQCILSCKDKCTRQAYIMDALRGSCVIQNSFKYSHHWFRVREWFPWQMGSWGEYGSIGIALSWPGCWLHVYVTRVCMHELWLFTQLSQWFLFMDYTERTKETFITRENRDTYLTTTIRLPLLDLRVLRKRIQAALGRTSVDRELPGHVRDCCWRYTSQAIG